MMTLLTVDDIVLELYSYGKVMANILKPAGLHVCVCMHMCVCVCTCELMYMCMHSFMHACVCVCACSMCIRKPKVNVEHLHHPSPLYILRQILTESGAPQFC